MNICGENKMKYICSVFKFLVLLETYNKLAIMVYSHEVQQMCVVKKGANHPCAPIPEEGGESYSNH